MCPESLFLNGWIGVTMSDLISRQAALDALSAYVNLDEYYHDRKCKNIPMLSAKRYLENAPSLEGVTGVIRCENCKWWNRLEDGHPYGYCRACRSGTHTERWEISIYRQNRYDFYCADAEPKENEDDDE